MCNGGGLRLGRFFHNCPFLISPPLQKTYEKRNNKKRKIAKKRGEKNY